MPVDSEHSAIAQCLRGGRADEVRRLVVTASGGPFRGRDRAELQDVTPEQALAHPNFAMGRVMTTNSATLVNKGLEVIEAHLLFDLPFDRVDVVVHPQQMIHSMVEFVDGSTIAQVSPPRCSSPSPWGCPGPTASLTPRRPRLDAGVDVDLPPARRGGLPGGDPGQAGRRAGGTAPAVYNAANEVCVDAFHAGLIPFTAIVDTVARFVEEHAGAAGRRSTSRRLAADGRRPERLGLARGSR